MTRPVRLVLALVAFMVVATANAGGYRYGVSDQAFYVPAIALRANPALFPRDRDLLEPQMRLWLGDEILGAVVRTTGVSLETLCAVLYIATLLTLAAGAIALGRSLGLSWPAIVLALVLLTLRHRIAKTGANSLEGYFHPRMLAFALGLFALAAMAARRTHAAVAWLLAAFFVHTSTAVWFWAAWLGAAIWPYRRSWHTWRHLAVAAVLLTLPLAVLMPNSLVIMSQGWVDSLGDRDYLFPGGWPFYAWATNLAYPAVLLAIYRARRRRGVLAPAEGPLVAGLIALVIGFLISVPIAQARLALAVQLQVNRIFWLLDAVVVIYLAWWLADAARWFQGRAARTALIATLAVAAAGRGFYVVRVEAGRQLVAYDLPDTPWTDVLHWIGRQPVSWHVLADPAHGWKYGSSVRVGALRDTLIETGKDVAMGLYDYDAAERNNRRILATHDYDALTTAAVRALDEQYELDVMIARAGHALDLPVLYRNAGFVVYDLR